MDRLPYRRRPMTEEMTQSLEEVARRRRELQEAELAYNNSLVRAYEAGCVLRDISGPAGYTSSAVGDRIKKLLAARQTETRDHMPVA